MKTATALSSIVVFLLAPAALCSPPTPRDIEACCCCVPGKNVISCTNAIKAKDCVCLAVVCPKGAPTIWENPKRPQATSTTTLAAGRQPDARPVLGDAGYNTAGPDPQAPPLKDIVITARGGRAPAPTPTLPVAPAGPSQALDKVEEDGANEMAPCCCCDVRHESYSCHMRKKSDCFCGQVMCPSRAPTVWNDAEPTAMATQRIGTVW